MRRRSPIQLKPLQTIFGRLLQPAIREFAGRNLGGDKDLLTRRSMVADRLPDLGLISVHGGRVDMAITGVQRGRDGVDDGVTTRIPGAESDRRDFGAVGPHNRCHRLPFFRPINSSRISGRVLERRATSLKPAARKTDAMPT